MGFYNQDTHSGVESFILKWTFISTFVGVVLTFIVKLLLLLVQYITSGKIVTDFGHYIWEALKAVIGF